MDAVIDTQAADQPGKGACEIVSLEDYRRARGLAPARVAVGEPDPFPWAYTFGPQQPAG